MMRLFIMPQYQYLTLGPLNELSHIYVKKAEVSTVKSITKFQSTTNEKFKQNIVKLV